MAALLIHLRSGPKSRTFSTPLPLISIGKGPQCDLILPLEWMEEVHLVVENGPEALRVRAGSAQAPVVFLSPVIHGREETCDGATPWVTLPSPGRVAVPTPMGGQLVIELTCIDEQLQTPLLRAGSAPLAPLEQSGLQLVSLDRLETGQGWFGQALPQGDDIKPCPAPARAMPRPIPQRTLAVLGALLVVLIVAALGFNRYRHAQERFRLRQATDFVADQIVLAEELMRKKQYASAKGALDSAAEVARSRPSLAEALGRIEALAGRPEIRLGAQGQVEMEGRWLTAELARAWQAARDRDDPKIAQLEQKAAEASGRQQFDEARAACEEALALMEGHPVKPHPRQAAVKAQAEAIGKQAIGVEMTAKGFVVHEGKWVSKEEKFRIEQEGKGLVEYQGLWMTREQMAEAQKQGGTGRVFHNGRWMTAEEKLEAEGHVRFEGVWLRPEQKEAILAQRREQARLAQEREEEERQAELRRQAEEAKAQPLKGPAFAASQDFVRKQLKLPLSAQFPAFEQGEVYVLFDAGWFIVRSPVSHKSETGVTVQRTYYCKLRPSSAERWEEAVTVVVE